MIGFFLAAIAYVRPYVVSRHQLALEVAALRQQLVVFKRKRPRPLLGNIDRRFWVTLLTMVVRLGWCLDHRKSRDSGLLAPRRLPAALASPLPATRAA
jgi:hypothetical protein